jgi:putative transposase
MTNHVHLLMTPMDRDGISNVMKVLGSRFAQYMNKKYRRTGTMWEGRHKASAVESETYLLKCYRYIELNPVAASMVERPEEYVWSSYCVNTYGDKSRVVEPHAQYRALGASPDIRCHRYRELFKEVLSTEDLHGIRRARSLSD